MMTRYEFGGLAMARLAELATITDTLGGPGANRPEGNEPVGDGTGRPARGRSRVSSASSAA